MAILVITSAVHNTMANMFEVSTFYIGYWILPSTVDTSTLQYSTSWVLGSSHPTAAAAAAFSVGLLRSAEMCPAPFQFIPIFCPRIPDICGRGHGQLVVSGLVVFL